MGTATQKLIETLKKVSEVQTGTESVSKDGQKYRYDLFILKYEHATNWLVKMFINAAIENGFKNYVTQFRCEDYSFHFARSPFKGSPNGKISFTQLIKL